MKINSRAFRSAVDCVARVVKPGFNPITALIKLSPLKESVVLTASNGDEFIERIVPVKRNDAEGFFNCLANPRQLLASLQLSGEEVEAKYDNGVLVVVSEAVSRVKTADADEFPATPEFLASAKKEVNCAELAAGISAVQFCANNNPARAELNSVHFKAEAGVMAVEAMDGSNGAFFQFPWAGELEFMVSVEHASRLKDALLAEGAELFLTDNLVAVKHALGSYCCKQLEAKFPNTKDLRCGARFAASRKLGTANAATVAETLSAAIPFWADNELPAMSVEFTPTGLKFESADFKREILGKFADHKTRVNATALKKCFAAFGDQEVSVGTGEMDFLRLEAGNLSVLTMSLREK